MKKILIWLTNTKAFSALLLKIIPYIRFSVYYTPFRGNKYNDAYKLIKRGDYIVMRDAAKATTLLIGGDWGHAGMFMGKVTEGARYEVAEMTHHNYTKSDFFDICKESSDIAIFRCKDFTPEYIDEMLNKCKSFEDAQYDVGFEMGVRALYCSELVYQADFERRLQVNLADLHALGRQYISPVGLSKALNVECIYDSRKYENRY